MPSNFSWRQLLKFAKLSQDWIAIAANAKTKLAYAIRRVTSQFEPLQVRALRELEDIDITHCLVDERGGIIGGEAGVPYSFTPEKKKIRRKEKDDYFDKAQFSVEPYFSTVVPDDLTEDELQAFEGFVIKAEDVARVRRVQEGEEARTALAGD